MHPVSANENHGAHHFIKRASKAMRALREPNAGENNDNGIKMKAKSGWTHVANLVLGDRNTVL